MNNENLVNLIDSNKEVLSTLPKNNKKNISKYIETLAKYKKEYSEKGLSLKEEIEKRKDKIVKKISINKDLDKLKNKVLKLEENIYLFETKINKLIKYNIEKNIVEKKELHVLEKEWYEGQAKKVMQMVLQGIAPPILSGQDIIEEY